MLILSDMLIFEQIDVIWPKIALSKHRVSNVSDPPCGSYCGAFFWLDLPDDFELSKAFCLRQWDQNALQEKLVSTFKRAMSGPNLTKTVRAPILRQIVAVAYLTLSPCPRPIAVARMIFKSSGIVRSARYSASSFASRSGSLISTFWI